MAESIGLDFESKNSAILLHPMGQENFPNQRRGSLPWHSLWAATKRSKVVLTNQRVAGYTQGRHIERLGHVPSR